ncbi:hypothetical protein [Haloarchaeobius salinus]|uniref:hypothetical protein n=1 Tax=Haloarchaeobius salinus TaxID=1198298 RepID=UPI00210CBB60|nr:hypothetical protein [Haloarchaeobius salinus]
MDTKQTFKLVGYYRLLSWLSFGVGMALVGLGIYLGLGETITIMLESFPAEFDAAVAAASPVITVALSVVGVVVWQIGKSIALTRTMARAIAAESDGSDDEQLKSEVLDVVNDQLSSVEKDLRSEIRKVERDAVSADDSPSTGTGVSASTGATGATGRSSTGSKGSSARSSGTGGSSRSAGDQSGSRRSSSRSGSERSSRSGRSQSGSTGEGGSSQSDAGSDDGGSGDGDRSERATDAVSGDEERSRRKTESDDDDDPLP